MLQSLVIYFGISLSVRSRYKSWSDQPLISWPDYYSFLILALSFLTSSRPPGMTQENRGNSRMLIYLNNRRVRVKSNPYKCLTSIKKRPKNPKESQHEICIPSSLQREIKPSHLPVPSETEVLLSLGDRLEKNLCSQYSFSSQLRQFSVCSDLIYH